MAFANYDTLRTAIGDWLNRGDLAAVTPTFIGLAESYFDKNLRAREMWATVSIAAVDGSAPLPANMAELATVRSLTRGNRQLEYVSPREATSIESTDRSRALDYYTSPAGAFVLFRGLPGLKRFRSIIMPACRASALASLLIGYWSARRKCICMARLFNPRPT